MFRRRNDPRRALERRVKEMERRTRKPSTKRVLLRNTLLCSAAGAFLYGILTFGSYVRETTNLDMMTGQQRTAEYKLCKSADQKPLLHRLHPYMVGSCIAVDHYKQD